MKYIDIADAQQYLLSLLEEISIRAVSREKVIITRDGVAVGTISFKVVKPEASKYPLRGLPIQIAEDFDEPLPELWEAINE